MKKEKKICSIVYSGLKNDLVFLFGKFSDINNKAKHIKELDQLCLEFKNNIKNKDLSETVIDILAKNLLQKNNWIVVYSDYNINNDLTESMSKNEVKEFIRRAKRGNVKFKFRKLDGTIRTACGTLKEDIIKKTFKDVENAKRRRHIPSSIIVYYDVEKDGWRSFRKSLFIKFIK